MRIVFFSVLVLITTPVVVPNELYTPKEQTALKKFYSMVNSELPHDYMHEDSYLIKWIRSVAASNDSELSVERFQNLTNSYYKISSEIDLNKAKKNLQATLKWRKDENLDNVLNEDFSYFKTHYPHTLEDGKNGAAIVTFNYAQWNFIKAVAEDPVRFQRYYYSILEKLSQIARNHKSNVTVLVDGSKYNKTLHECEKCFAFIYDKFFEPLQTHYPQLLNRFVVINTPVEMYAQVANHLDKNLSEDKTKVYGDDAEEYLKDLDTFIPRENIPKTFAKPFETTPKPVTIPDWLSLWKACAGCNLG